MFEAAGVQWSDNWQVIDEQADGHDHYGYTGATTLRLAKIPGYVRMWTNNSEQAWTIGNERIEVFVLPESIDSAKAALRAAGHTIHE